MLSTELLGLMEMRLIAIVMRDNERLWKKESIEQMHA
jgi:hypothetical protein